MSRWQSYAIVSLVAALVMFTNLGGPRLWDRDEPRNAGCAAEMLAGGDWVVPVFNGELRTHKPVLLYWLMMAAYSFFGVSEFTARLPSALLAIGTSLCTVEMGRHLFSPRAGVWAGIVIATSLMFAVAGRAATPDATLIFFSTLAVTIFALGITTPQCDLKGEGGATKSEGNGAFSLPRAIGIYGAMGFATLAKGPVGIVLPAATIGLFQLLTFRQGAYEAPRGWRERCVDFLSKFTPQRIYRTCWQLRPWTATAAILAVAAPWYILVGLRTDGEFLRGFFLEHNLNRAVSTMEGHRGNILFYPITLLVGLFPWSVLAIPIMIDLRQRFRQRSEKRQRTTKTKPLTPANHDPSESRDVAGYLLAACWLAVYLSIFSLAKTKLPSYITPSYPAAAMLIGVFIERWVRGTVQVSKAWMQAACGVLMLVGAVITAAIPLALQEKLPGEHWLGLIGTVPLVAGLAAWWSVRNEQARRATWCIAGSAAAFATLLFAVGAERADRHQLNHRLLSAIDQHSNNPRIAAFGCLEPSWVFYGGHSIDEITDDGKGPTHSPFISVNGQWIPKPPVRIADVASETDSFIITTKRELAAARKLLPQDFQILEIVPLFLKNEELILLGRPDPIVVARQKVQGLRSRVKSQKEMLFWH